MHQRHPFQRKIADHQIQKPNSLLLGLENEKRHLGKHYFQGNSREPGATSDIQNRGDPGNKWTKKQTALNVLKVYILDGASTGQPSRPAKFPDQIDVTVNQSFLRR